MTDFPTTHFTLPASHHGSWKGPNRLWMTDPANPSRCEGTKTVAPRSIAYNWSYKGKEHVGTIELKGQPAALTAAWHDTFHAAERMTLHGFNEAHVLRLFTTYDAGDATWGWQIEVDCRDPEACVLRMFNVMPEMGVVPAVVLFGARVG